LEQPFGSLLVVLVENGRPSPYDGRELPDDAFIRGEVPMTKSEVRSVCLQKLALTKGFVLYDIGAGTGSVGIQASLSHPDGFVYAVERKEEALSLIRENKRKFAADSLEVVSGTAPDCLEGLPVPTHAFVGGSAGHMRELLDYLWSLNPKIRIVVTVIALETLTELLDFLKEKQRDAELVQMTVAKAKQAGGYHLLMGQNPVTIVTIGERLGH
jgi:precorrin-6Y C5,15-methyltransferase (decarboxylating)